MVTPNAHTSLAELNLNRLMHSGAHLARGAEVSIITAVSKM